MPPLHRYLGNPVLSFLGRLCFGIPVGDFHCGIRAFRRDAIQQLQLKTTGMEFASEMVVGASLIGLEDQRGAHRSVPGWPKQGSSPADVARRLASSALSTAVQPAMAVFVSRPDGDRDRISHHRVVSVRTCHRQSPLRRSSVIYAVRTYADRRTYLRICGKCQGLWNTRGVFAAE